MARYFLWCIVNDRYLLHNYTLNCPEWRCISFAVCVCFAQVGDFADANSWPTPGEIATKDMQVGVGARFEKKRLIETAPTLTKRQNRICGAETVFSLEFHIELFYKTSQASNLKIIPFTGRSGPAEKSNSCDQFYSLFQLKVTDMRCVWRWPAGVKNN